MEHPHGQDRAPDMLQKEQLTAGAQHPRGLYHCPTIVGDRTERERRDYRVEGGIWERQVLGIADAQIGLASQLPHPAAGDAQHLGAEFEAGEAYVPRI